MSRFQTIGILPDDPILSIPIAFAADDRTQKVNLGIGAYRNDQGEPVVLSAIQKAEAEIVAKHLHKEYPPIVGLVPLHKEGLKLIFGDDSPWVSRPEMVAVQTIGASGALRVTAELFKQTVCDTIYLSDPSWSNHHLIFSRAGLKCEYYPYYNHKTHYLDFSAMCESIKKMPANSAILLHASSHNPTGRDPSQEQWQELSALLLKQGVIPFFDLAYQGLGNGLDYDAYPIRLFAEQGHELFVSYSFSKNFGLYGERLGLLVALTKDGAAAKNVQSHIKQIIRGMYSMPPVHGARIAHTILENPQLKQEWLQELAKMRERITQMRLGLMEGLKKNRVGYDPSYMATQSGFFCYLGLSEEQVQKVKHEHGIYMVNSSRISVPGLNSSNLDYVVNSILNVLHAQ